MPVARDLAAFVSALALAMAMAVFAPATVRAQQPEFYDVPFAPGQWNIGRRVDASVLRYCVDERDPDWEVADAIAEAIAAGLLLRPERYVVDSDMVQEDITKVYQVLLEHCDIHMGFKLIPEGLPEWVTATRPYYEARYEFVTDAPDLTALSDLEHTQPIAATMGTTAHLRLLAYVTSVGPDERWPVFPMGTNDLTIDAVREGTAGVALLWGPSFWAMARENAALADFHTIDPSPLQPVTLGVGALLLADQTYLRTAVDEAIAALSADGTIGAILESYDFAATTAP